MSAALSNEGNTPLALAHQRRRMYRRLLSGEYILTNCSKMGRRLRPSPAKLNLPSRWQLLAPCEETHSKRLKLGRRSTPELPLALAATLTPPSSLLRRLRNSC